MDSWRYIIRSLVSELSAAEPLPFWPDGKAYAVVLTHDIDSDYSLRDSRGIDQLRSIEENVDQRLSDILRLAVEEDRLGIDP